MVASYRLRRRRGLPDAPSKTLELSSQLLGVSSKLVRASRAKDRTGSFAPHPWSDSPRARCFAPRVRCSKVRPRPSEHRARCSAVRPSPLSHRARCPNVRPPTAEHHARTFLVPKLPLGKGSQVTVARTPRPCVVSRDSLGRGVRAGAEQQFRCKGSGTGQMVFCTLAMNVASERAAKTPGEEARIDRETQACGRPNLP